MLETEKNRRSCCSGSIFTKVSRTLYANESGNSDALKPGRIILFLDPSEILSLLLPVKHLIVVGISGHCVSVCLLHVPARSSCFVLASASISLAGILSPLPISTKYSPGGTNLLLSIALRHTLKPRAT